MFSTRAGDHFCISAWWSLSTQGSTQTLLPAVGIGVGSQAWHCGRSGAIHWEAWETKMAFEVWHCSLNHFGSVSSQLLLCTKALQCNPALTQQLQEDLPGGQ